MTGRPLSLSRRSLLEVLGGAAAGVTVARTGAADRAAAPGVGAPSGPGVDFHGDHQAGITNPAPSSLHFAAFDLATADRSGLVDLLHRWTAAARLLCGGDAGTSGQVPGDSGETLDLPASQLTLTLGLGSSLFDGRFGLGDRRPAALQELPDFSGDVLEAARSGGDLCVQACADDPKVALHAVRTLIRLAAGTATVRWTQPGFGTVRHDGAPVRARNVLGFKEGTGNLRGDDAAAVADHVWVAPGDDPGAAWMAGGSYLVARRVTVLVDTWDATALGEQEAAVGRTKVEGAPLGLAGAHEHDPVEVSRLPATSHVRLSHPDNHGGARMLRRGYGFADASDRPGTPDVGVFFLSFQRDPATFVSMQSALARDDALGRFMRHTGSSLWAIPPGVTPDGWWGQGLLGG